MQHDDAPAVQENDRSDPVPSHGSLIVDTERFCIRCGYLLRGLPRESPCPECGTPVELSLREPTIAAASPEYQAALRQGLSLVLNGILLLIVVKVAGIVAVALMPSSGGRFLAQVATLAVEAMMVWGYWRYSEPDPSTVALESTRAARKVLRIMVVADFATNALLTLGNVLAPATMVSIGSGANNPATTFAAVVVTIVGVVSLVAGAAKFFALMRYTRWIATRIPDPYIVRKTNTYMWLLPVLWTVGWLILIGPLIALLLFWNLLDRARKHMKSITATGERANLPKLDLPMPPVS